MFLGGMPIGEAVEALLLVFARHVVRAPCVQRERRIGDDAIVKDQVAVGVEKARVADRVALFNPGVAQPVQEQVHLGDGPSPEVLFLPVQRDVDRLAEALALDVAT